MFSEVQKTSSIFFFYFSPELHPLFVTLISQHTESIDALAIFLSKAKKKVLKASQGRAHLNRSAMPLQNPSSSQFRDAPCGSWEREDHLSHWTSGG